MPEDVEPLGTDTGMAEYIGAMINACGRDDMGKTCLQKTAYILQANEVGFPEIVFDYHKYGPFSPMITFAADDAKAFGYITTESYEAHPFPYTVFRPTESAPRFADCEATRKIRKVLKILRRRSMVELELAATAIYLKRNGHEENFIEEVKKRKSFKASERNMGFAKNLLSELRL